MGRALQGKVPGSGLDRYNYKAFSECGGTYSIGELQGRSCRRGYPGEGVVDHLQGKTSRTVDESA